MTDLLLSFDTEDYVTPQAADAQKWWAEELRGRGIRATFQVVAELIRAHRRNGRGDVTEALAGHEIGYHTDRHSAPPHVPVVLDERSLADGIRWIIEREAEGWALLARTFARAPISYCPAGDSWTPQGALALASMGCKVLASGMSAWEIPPCWYCGQLAIGYDMAFESLMEEAPAEERKFIERFDALRERRGDGLIVLYSHPTRLVTTEFWDAPFYRNANPSELPPAPLRPPARVAAIKDRIRRLLDRFQREPGLRFVDMATVYAERAAARLDLQALLDQCGLKPGEEGRLPLRDPAGADPAVLAALDAFRYRWPLYPEKFKGEQLRALMKQLAWTFRPAPRSR